MDNWDKFVGFLAIVLLIGSFIYLIAGNYNMAIYSILIGMFLFLASIWAKANE